jgi:hypothetical protein
MNNMNTNDLIAELQAQGQDIKDLKLEIETLKEILTFTLNNAVLKPVQNQCGSDDRPCTCSHD